MFMQSSTAFINRCNVRMPSSINDYSHRFPMYFTYNRVIDLRPENNPQFEIKQCRFKGQTSMQTIQGKGSMGVVAHLSN